LHGPSRVFHSSKKLLTQSAQVATQSSADIAAKVFHVIRRSFLIEGIVTRHSGTAAKTKARHDSTTPALSTAQLHLCSAAQLF